MKLVEKFIYATVVFVATYIILSLSLRLFELTSSYVSHLVGGVVAMGLGMGLFMYLLIFKKEIKS